MTFLKQHFLAASEQQSCAKGDRYDEDCNACICDDAGVFVCTQTTCDDGPTFKDNTQRGAVGCPNGPSYMEDCNLCSCVDEKFYDCTTRACYHGRHFPTLEQSREQFQRNRREVNVNPGKYDLPGQPTLNFLSFEMEMCTPGEVKNKVRSFVSKAAVIMSEYILRNATDASAVRLEEVGSAHAMIAIRQLKRLTKKNKINNWEIMFAM